MTEVVILLSGIAVLLLLLVVLQIRNWNKTDKL